MEKDQTVLSYLFGSLSKEIFAQVSSAMPTASLWAAIEGLNASQSRARVITMRMALATVSKGASSIADYFAKMKGLANDMALAGRKLEDEEMVSYILAGLDMEYNAIISALATRLEPITLDELYIQLEYNAWNGKVEGPVPPRTWRPKVVAVVEIIPTHPVAVVAAATVVANVVVTAMAAAATAITPSRGSSANCAPRRGTPSSAASRGSIPRSLALPRRVRRLPPPRME